MNDTCGCGHARDEHTKRGAGLCLDDECDCAAFEASADEREEDDLEAEPELYEEPAPPSPEKETVTAMPRSKWTPEQREAQSARIKAAIAAKRGGAAVVQPKKAKRLPKPVFDVGDSQLLDVARALNIDVAELLRREIASVLGLEQP